MADDLVPNRRDPGVLGPFVKGMNNRLPDYALGQDRVRSIVNADLHSTGHLRRRSGRTRIVSASNPHSVWADGDEVYFVTGTDLCRFRLFGSPPFDYEVLRSTLVANDPLWFESFNGAVYYAGLESTGRVVGAVDLPWGVVAPASAPTLAEMPGQLNDGRYQVTYTYMTVTGEESGAPRSAVITISHTDRSQEGTKGILVSGLVAPTDPQVAYINVYCTPPNSVVAYRQFRLPITATGCQITNLDSSGATLRTQLLSPMPAGEQMFILGGRAYTVSGALLQYSTAFALGLHDSGEGFVPFPSEIAVAMPVPDGVYVALVDGPTYFLAGLNPLEWVARQVLPYGAVRRTGVRIGSSNAVAWFGANGLIMADTGGSVKAVQQDEVTVETAGSGVSLYRDENGLEQVITVLHNAVSQRGAFRGYLTE